MVLTNFNFGASVLAFSGVIAGCNVGADSTSKDVFVPAGSFVAGADCDARKVEPGCDRSYFIGRRPISLKSFYVDRDLVTSGAYESCVSAGACIPLKPRSSSLLGVTLASFEDAQAFCRWRGEALPTPEQFERIARGTDGRAEPWNNDDSPCRDSRPSYACLDYEGPAGARSVAFNAQWVADGTIRGASQFTFEALPRAAAAAFRCARPGE